MIKDIISSAAGGRPLVLVSVVSSKGSTPRSAGAMMTVDESGLLAGTIGGGALEGRCLEEAVSFLKRLGSGGKKARPSGFLRSFSLNNSQAGDLGMICGGSTDVLFTPVLPEDRGAFREALSCMEAGEASFLLLPLDGSAPAFQRQPGDGSQSLRKPCLCTADSRSCLSIPLTASSRVFLLGGGHVSLELSLLLDRLEFPYFVIDDREEFASRERFQKAAKTIVIPLEPALLSEALTKTLAPRDRKSVV